MPNEKDWSDFELWRQDNADRLDGVDFLDQTEIYAREIQSHDREEQE